MATREGFGVRRYSFVRSLPRAGKLSIEDLNTPKANQGAKQEAKTTAEFGVDLSRIDIAPI